MSKKIIRAYLFLHVSFLLCFNLSFSQNNDSIFSVIDAGKDDTSKVNELNAFTRGLVITGDFVSAITGAGKALELADKLDYEKGKAIAYTMFGVTYFGLGNYPDALKNHYASLKIREELNDQKAVAATYHNIGNVYYSQHNTEEAMKCFETSLKIKQKIRDTMDTHYSHTLNNIANYYKEAGDIKKAIKLYEASLKIAEQLNDLLGIISTKNNIANIYMNEGNYPGAEKIYFECLKIAEELGDKASISAIYIGLGNLYVSEKDFKKARKYVITGMELAKQIGSRDDIKNGYYYLAQIEEGFKNYKESFNYFVLYSAYRDSLDNEENTRTSVQAKMLYEFSKKEAMAKAEQDKKDLAYAAAQRSQRIILWSTTAGIILAVLFSFFLYNRFRLARKQKQIIEAQKREVDSQRELAATRMAIAENQKQIIEEKQKEILDSIRYAQRIQSSLLPSEKFIGKNLDRLVKAN